MMITATTKTKTQLRALFRDRLAYGCITGHRHTARCLKQSASAIRLNVSQLEREGQAIAGRHKLSVSTALKQPSFLSVGAALERTGQSGRAVLDHCLGFEVFGLSTQAVLLCGASEVAKVTEAGWKPKWPTY